MTSAMAQELAAGQTTRTGAAPSHPSLAVLKLEFASDKAAREYARALTSLLYGVAEERVVFDGPGGCRDDLEFREITQRIESKASLSLAFRIEWEGELQKVSIDLSATSVAVRARFALDEGATGVLWLQADADHLGPLPVIALPTRPGAFTGEALHSLVALGARIGDLCGASLHAEGQSTPRRTWTVARQGADLPVIGAYADTVWLADGGVAESPTAPAVWCSPEQIVATDTVPTDEWWSRFDDLTRAASRSLQELEDHLRILPRGGQRWRFDDLAVAHHADYMVPPEDGLALALVPRESEVVVSIDLRIPVETLQTLLLHALGHLALGHVRPGDRWGHWDTVDTGTGHSPHRQWDQEAREYVAEHWKRHVVRHVESLDECTPAEKVQLGLWRMIGEMLGESRSLHAAAERYQRAVYQRQAAQRIVAMLEDYGGALLCDGVGLGKSYVATTIMVHYANCWRDQWAATPDRLLDDPFRITVLAPNSVVSTWRREALPMLASFGVPLSTIRVISHTKLSRMSSASELLQPVRKGLSDLEHLLLSDLVIVDEAHNFRSLAARRTKILRDLLRLQPRRETRRRVVLLTATPLNNSLEDLRQEVSLLFTRPLVLSEGKTDDGYRRQAVKEIHDRCLRARRVRSQADVAGLVVHGQADARFSDTIEFRDDLDFGPNVQRIGDYLKEQDNRLKELQASIRAAVQNKSLREDGATSVRIAEDLLDRIVVQRSRTLCKEIEKQQASNVELLFRPDAGLPEKLHYSDEYDGIEDVLARFLPLFDSEGNHNKSRTTAPLSLKVYMWYDVREGLKDADGTSSVVGLQRVLVLKRLESSPVSFLITLLRLTVLHAYRLQQLANLCLEVADKAKHRELQADIQAVLNSQKKTALEKVRTLATGKSPSDPRHDFVRNVGAAYVSGCPAADTDDAPQQLLLFPDEEEGGLKHEQLERLWALHDPLVKDFDTLLTVTPELADIVFGRFARSEWPRRFIAGGEDIDWPHSSVWGLRLVTDPKLRQLVARLIVARRARQKVIVFSQFSDTIAYVRSVLAATQSFQRSDWQIALRGLGIPNLTSNEIIVLREATSAITGDTEDRDDVVNAFAPFYRICPWRPATDEATESERTMLNDSWETAWTGAMARGIDVLLSSDVLAEGVNLQDVALLVNFDVHWNPVRMIQRTGRIDRRLNPRIEQLHEFPDLGALAARLGKPMPRYYWHDHAGEAPVTINMILPDKLEAELLLRERIATKTMAIDFTLGLEQGTGAEADWMESYKYHGITSLNSFQKDRAIEQIASHHERLSRRFAEIGIMTGWVDGLNGWFRAADAKESSPLIARALLGLQGGELERFQRYLEPVVLDGVLYWFWAEKRPGESLFDGWLVLDGKTWPPPTPRRDIPWGETVAGPVKATHLLAVLEFLERSDSIIDWSKANRGVGRLLQQGASAIAAPKFGEDRHLVRIPNVFVIQLASFSPEQAVTLATQVHTESRLAERRTDIYDGANHAK